jgi:hypothetical protein
MDYAFTSEQAKKLILDAPLKTRKVAYLLGITGIVLLVLLGQSYYGTTNDWTCELDKTDTEHSYACAELRNFTSCRTISGPLSAEISLNIKGEVRASANVTCPWTNGTSEIRICVAVVSLLCVVLGLLALSREDKSLAELQVNAAYFISLMLVIASVFDLVAISNSTTNNYTLCSLTGEYQLEAGISKERMDCFYDSFTNTAYVGFLSALLVFVSALQVKDWRQKLTLADK